MSLTLREAANNIKENLLCVFFGGPDIELNMGGQGHELAKQVCVDTVRKNLCLYYRCRMQEFCLTPNIYPSIISQILNMSRDEQ